MIQVQYHNDRFEMQLLEECSVSDHIRQHGTFYELDFLEAMSRRLSPNTVVFDVGAHIGNHTIFFARILGMRVVAFEPNPEAFDALQQNVRTAGVSDLVTCIPAALSDHQGTALMARHSRDDQGTTAITDAEDVTGSFEARTDLLDSFIGHARDDTETYVKLDVEGHEARVLVGGRAFITSVRPHLISAEFIDESLFDAVAEELGWEYSAAGLFNATPSVLFQRVTSIQRDWANETARYGVVKALDRNDQRLARSAASQRANELADRLIDLNDHLENEREFRSKAEQLRKTASQRANELADRLADLNDRLENEREARSKAHKRVEQLESDHQFESRITDAVLSQLSPPGSEIAEDRLGVERLGRWIRFLRSEGRSSVRSHASLAFVVFGDTDLPAASLSVLYGRVDAIRISHTRNAIRIEMQRWKNGTLGSSQSSTRSVRASALIGAEISLFLEGDQTQPPMLAILVGAESHPELAETVINLMSLQYLLIAHDPGYTSRRLRIELGALGCAVLSEDDLARWASSHPVPAEVIDLGQPASVVGMIDTTINRVVNSGQHLVSVKQPPKRTKHRVLLISYFAPPSTPVSVHRLGYWHSQLAALADERGFALDVTWLSATARASELPGTVVIPDRGDITLPVERLRPIERLRSLRLSTLGASWSGHVEERLGAVDGPYDSVIISGGPFLYMDLARPIKEAWGSRVILDFRDPFARELRFDYSVDQRAALIKIEDQIVHNADAVISVNDECLSAIAPQLEVERQVVSNGFNEAVIEAIPPRQRSDGSGGLIRLAYSGTVFAHLPIDHLLDALSPSRAHLWHFGRDYSSSRAAAWHVSATQVGLVPYFDLIDQLKGMDAGIIMTSGEPSTQTTKIFDYIACDLDIIIVTKGEPRTGNLHEVTKDLAGVHWVRNDPAHLREFFASFVPTRPSRPQREQYSRRHQTSLLLDLIWKLEDR